MFYIKDLSFRYKGAERDALSNVSLKPQMGKVNVIVGLNGAGKTTLFDIITGVLKSSSGLYNVPKGTDILYQLQDIPFPGRLKGRDIVRLLLQVDTPGNFKDKYQNLLDSIDARDKEYLNKLWSRRFGDMSRGERRWLFTIVMCQLKRKLYIFDEPTAGIDPDARVRIISRIAELSSQKNKLILMSTHILGELQFIDCVINILHDGKVMFTGTYSEFLSNYGTDNPDVAFQHAVSITN